MVKPEDTSEDDKDMREDDQHIVLDDDYMSLDDKDYAPDRHTNCSDLNFVRPSQLVYPKSQYDGWMPPDDHVPELAAIWTLEEEYERCNAHEGGYKIFVLSDFSVYRTEGGEGKYEFVPLHQLKVAPGLDDLFFDGVISVGGVRKYVQRVRFSTVTIEGYGDAFYEVFDICIQSISGANRDVWYSLGKPAREYERYHEPFLWIAEFAKHFVDYMSHHESVHLENLREDFYIWVQLQHDHRLKPMKWLSDYGRRDFRQAFIAYSGFLWKESFAVDEDADFHPIWAEACPGKLCAIEREPIREDKTIVTPYVFECFKHMYFQDQLTRREISDPEVIRAHQKRIAFMGFTTTIVGPNGTTREEQPSKYSLPGPVRIGSVISVGRDETSKWKDDSSVWYAYVQGIRADPHPVSRHQTLDVIWLYRPSETILFKGSYPWRKELFFSDNCNCGDAKLLASDVLHTVHIEWFGRNSDTVATFFVRQKYCTNGGANSFRDLQSSDFTCPCQNKKSRFTKITEKFRIGDAVLVRIRQALEPCILVNFWPEVEEVSIRRLERLKGKVDSAKPNELGWTEDIATVKATKLIRKCHIRAYAGGDRRGGLVPPPYNRNGSANCWYITAKTNKNEGNSESIQDLEPGCRLPFNEGFDPQLSGRQSLSGIDLFCGEGGFGRGLEECGAVEMKYAVDLDEHAMHTWIANKKTENAKVFHGSANDNLAQAMSGSSKENVARIGEIRFSVAGSPCQGYCHAQPNKQSDESRRNSSLVALVVAFLDFYRPEYGILENVPAMARDIANQNVFAQILCALVGMGYQTQHFVLDACSTGNSQSRSRLFVVVTAPGFQALDDPPLTHAYPVHIRAHKLGVDLNGTPFGQRWLEDAYPFDCVTARDAIDDLPDIGDSHVQVCIKYPDHRACHMAKKFERCLIAMIPTVPYGMNFVEARRKGIMAKPKTDEWPWDSKGRKEPNENCFARVRPDRLLPTVTTQINPGYHKGGPCLHPDQPRILTLMEIRRAQGIPDDVVLVGSLRTQRKLVGNGVAYGMSLSLGMSMREAWLAGPDSTQPHVLS